MFVWKQVTTIKAAFVLKQGITLTNDVYMLNKAYYSNSTN